MSKTLRFLHPALLLLILCGLSSAQSPNPQVTGTLTYRERMALPPDAMIQVQLLDVSRADSPSKTIAESMLNAEGRQVPIPFTLGYDPAEIIPAHRYSVRATIRSADGMLMFSTTQSYPVITNGAPSRVNLVLFRVGKGPKPGAAAAKPSTGLPAQEPAVTSSAAQPPQENEPAKSVAETPATQTQTSAAVPAPKSEGASAEPTPETPASPPPAQEPSTAKAADAQDQAPAAEPTATTLENPKPAPSETADQTAAVTTEPQAPSTPGETSATATKAQAESKSEPTAEVAQKVQPEASQTTNAPAESQASAGERDLTGAEPSTPPSHQADNAAPPKPVPDSASSEPATPAKPAEPEPALPEAPSAVAKLSPPVPDSSSAGPEPRGEAAPPEGESTPESSSRPERPSVSTPLADTQWRLIQLGTENIVITPPDRPMTLAFSPEGKRIAGSAGCNSYIGTFHDDHGHLALNPGNMTLMGCGDKAMARQQKFVAAMRDADGFRISGNYLVLTSKGKVIARFINQLTQ